MTDPFHVSIDIVDRGKGVWKTARVNIFQNSNGSDQKIGEYSRNHAGWCESTFHPFQQGDRWYALYSPDYTATRVMELPSCKDIAGEEPHSGGFCPVDFYVPYENRNVVNAAHAGLFGFVAGCIWGDDSSWKIQHLDLSQVSKGVLIRKELFGYVEMPAKVKRLRECVCFDYYLPPDYEVVELAVSVKYDLKTGQQSGPV